MIRGRRLIWQIYPPFILIILLALLAVTWLFVQFLDDFYRGNIRRGLEAQGKLISHQISPHLQSEKPSSLQTVSRTLGKLSGTRLTIILADGRVIGDSEEDPARMDNHASRPEVQLALGGKIGEATRYSSTLRQEMMYVALPVFNENRIIGIVRTALPISRIDKTLRGVFIQAVNSGLLIALVAGLFSLWISRRISRPLEEMRQGAESFAQGDFNRKLPGYASEELGSLAQTMNQMAAQLDERIRTVVSQRNEQEAVLASMIEGVFAVDNNERMIRINQAAAQLLDIDPEKAKGQRIQEVVRKPGLQKFIRRSLQSESRIETDLSLLHQGKELFLQAHGTPLQGAEENIGALVVVHDVTRLRRLENLRRDFVANVSHELKTPITAIKGAVETLLSGASENPQDSQRFLDIAGRQAERLNAIIDDLLALSRLEQDSETEAIKLKRTELRTVLEAARQSCSSAAMTKQVDIQLSCPENLISTVNAPLLEQAVVNLVDNAIKYSPDAGVISISAQQDGTRVRISVQDHGQGIAQEHLPRLFERFYRVDAARSRAVGGTGLGLAIVKHIVQAHGGEVTVKSVVGQGSEFTLTLTAS